jgi:hypothetical protein
MELVGMVDKTRDCYGGKIYERVDPGCSSRIDKLGAGGIDRGSTRKLRT